MKMNVVCILYIYNLCKQDVVYVKAQYPLDNYCSHYKDTSMLPTKMDSCIKTIGNTQYSYVSIVYWTIESHYIITNVMYSMHVKIISPNFIFHAWYIVAPPGRCTHQLLFVI